MVAGAEIITTNTYQASVDGFQKYFELSASDSYRLIKDAVFFVERAIALEKVARHSDRRGIAFIYFTKIAPRNLISYRASFLYTITIRYKLIRVFIV